MEYCAGVLEQVKDVLSADLVIDSDCLKFKNGFSSSPVVLPGSKPGLIDRFHLDVHYCGSVITVLALVDQTASDLTILDDKSGLLPDEVLNNADPPEGQMLVDQITWMINTIDNYQKKLAYQNEKVRPILDLFNNSIQQKYFSSYEVRTKGSQVIFIVKRKLPPIDFANSQPLFELTEKNRFNKSGDNYFIIKLSFDKSTGKPDPNETDLYFPKRVKLMIPDYEIPTMSWPQTWRPEDCEAYLVATTNDIENALKDGSLNWGHRANFFLSIYSHIKDSIEDPEDNIIVNGEKMNVLTVSIDSAFHEASLEISLDENFPVAYPEYHLIITIDEVHTKAFKLKPKKIHKTKPFEEGWSIEEMASEIVKYIPCIIDKGVEIVEERAEIVKERARQNQIIKNVGTIQKDDEGDDCLNFHDKLVKSRIIEMNKEVELKTKTFKKLEQEKVNLKKEITELEKRKATNLIEYEERHGRAKQEIKIMDQDIENIEITLAKKKELRDNATTRQLLDSNQTDSTNENIKQEIESLKRKMNDIEKEQGDLPKKQKVNEGLPEFISNKIEDKQKALECPVCFETAETPIYQCTEGHLICKKCLPKLKICSECRSKYPKKPFRNRFAEKMYEELNNLFTERKALLDGI